MTSSPSLLSSEEILSAVAGSRIMGNPQVHFTSVSTDSRKLSKQSLFVPLIGNNADGHDFVQAAVKKGATTVFVAEQSLATHGAAYDKITATKPDVSLVVVPNTLTALQQAAACYVGHFPRLIKIAVTGSSGKTTTKELAAAMLSQKYSVIKNEGNLNSETGLPLSVFKIRDTHEVGVFELGMNRPGEIAEIAAVLKPQHAIITNIGSAHIGMLGSREAIAREKAHVFDHFIRESIAVIPADDDFAQFLARSARGEKVFYGESEPSSTVRFVGERGLDGTEFSIAGQRGLLALPGRYNYRDMLGAIAMAQAMGLSASEVIAGVAKVQPLDGRSQVLRGTYTIVQDCYNANPESVSAAIDFMASLENVGRRVLVLGDMLELGDDSEKCHEQMGLQAAQSGVNAVVFVGSQSRAAYQAAQQLEAKCKLSYAEGSDDKAIKAAVSAVKRTARPGDVVLVKASRGMQLERVVTLLEGGA